MMNTDDVGRSLECNIYTIGSSINPKDTFDVRTVKFPHL